MLFRSKTTVEFSVRNGRRADVGEPHMVFKTYEKAEREAIVWIAFVDYVICSSNDSEVWFHGGIWSSIGRNWMMV